MFRGRPIRDRRAKPRREARSDGAPCSADRADCGRSQTRCSHSAKKISAFSRSVVLLLLWLLWLLSCCPSCLAMNLILDKGDEYMDAPPAGWRVKFRDDATLILKRHERKEALVAATVF